MPTLVTQPTRISAAGTKPKLIEEFIGRVNTKTAGVSVAHMHSPQGWEEPGQTPEFDEFTLVLKGRLRVQHKAGHIDVTPGQAVIAHAGEWIQYSTPPKAAPNISPSACPRSPWTRFTATNNQPSGLSDLVLLVSCPFVPASFIPQRKFHSIPKSKFVVDQPKMILHHMLACPNEVGNFAVLQSLSD